MLFIKHPLHKTDWVQVFEIKIITLLYYFEK